MSRSELFEKLGAPLRNPRWSWGAVSKSGNVYLTVWTDQFRRIKEKNFVRLTHNKVSGSKQRNLGYLERLEHVALISKGAKSYGVLCTVKDELESPRRMLDFNRRELLVGGELIKHNGDWWLEDRSRKSMNLVERSPLMMITSYYLARCGERRSNGPAGPPVALGVVTWKEAYDVFYDAMGDGRTPSQFGNSMKNARDTFDILFDNGRIGWIDKDGQQPSLSYRFKHVDEQWKDRSDKELETFVLDLLKDMPMPGPTNAASQDVKTEGGERVFISVRRERNSTLRNNALAIHGYDCMACGFNFEEFYGEIGKGFIEVHHVVPLANAGETETNPKTDLVVLCANCHSMVHRQKSVCLSMQEIRKHIRGGKK